MNIFIENNTFVCNLEVSDKKVLRYIKNLVFN